MYLVKDIKFYFVRQKVKLLKEYIGVLGVSPIRMGFRNTKSVSGRVSIHTGFRRYRLLLLRRVRIRDCKTAR